MSDPKTMPSVSNAPGLDTQTAERLAAELFGVSARASALPSERDQNFRLDASDGRAFVLKIANPAEDRRMLEAENAMMRHLAATALVPAVVLSSAGGEIAEHDGHLVRLISWLQGRPLASVPRHSDALLRDLGRAIGRVDAELAGFDHPAVHRDFYWDLVKAPGTVARALPDIADEGMRRPLQAVLDVYRDHVAPRLDRLRRSVIHGDANDYNVLVNPQAQIVTGLVDFGDMVVSHTVNDVAVAMAYAALDKPDPLAAAAEVAAGCHEVFPLSDDEIAALFGLMIGRLALSVAVASDQQKARPDVAYLGISQTAIARTLPRLVAIHPRLAHYRLRSACGLVPVPQAPRVVAWLQSQAERLVSLTGHDMTSRDVVGLDFSAGSALVASNPADNATAPFTQRVFDAIERAGGVVGAGGYNEARLIYTTDNYATGTITDERRTIHLGIDVTLGPSAPLYAPLDGVVHGFEDAGLFDYGPVIVLRHEIPGDDPITFYTLYGHLERQSLEGLEIGRAVKAGERLGAIGPPPENGGWWPHVHVQIITDMLDIPCNFNGVARASERDTWLSISPDTNLILGIPPERFARHPATKELLEERRKHFGGNVSLSYGNHPLQIVRGWKQYLFDETGRTFIDAYNNVPHVGHAHPGVTQAVAAQLATLNTNTRYLHELPVQFAAALTARFPAPLEVCYFTASGSEANELAIRLARAKTGRRDLIVLDAAYHGHTTTMIDVSPYKHTGPGGTGTPDWVQVAAVPDVYRGKYRAGDPEAGAKYAAEVGVLIEKIQSRGRGPCGFLAETCPSVGGQIMPPAGYFTEVYRRVRAAGGVCIADEVQTGFGRLGTRFWAFEAHGVVPDIVVLGKPIANGYPMGAVITTRAIADSFDNGMEFFSTFGGSTAACAAGLATLRATVDEGLQAHALDVGAHLISELRRLQATHDLIGDVRGSGLFLGVELVRDRETLVPATEEASAIVDRMRELGVLVGTDGPFHNVIQIRGPMPLAKSDADCVVVALDQALKER